MKNFFQIIGIITLTIGSFIYTEKVTIASKESDTLLTEIKSKKDGYKENAIEPIIKDGTIIPGLNGIEVDVNKSYNEMKKVGYFEDKLLIYKTLKVENSLDKNKDKYIISGNNSKKNITLIFKTKTKNLKQIINTLNKKQIKSTFFIESTYLEKNQKQIINLINNGNTVGNLSKNEDYKDSDFIWMKTIITNIGPQIYNYCYTEKPNKTILKTCEIQNSFTIMPTVIIKQNPFINIKKELKPGTIISLEVTEELENELEVIINYITNKGYVVTSLEKLLEE